ncbi:MAG TPA: hypothetical protein VEC99_12165 [Clostridia bacterium]|nr:hypothetical protein [Clostridia bacterium]
MKPQKKLTTQQQAEEQAAQLEQAQQQAGLEFANAEEMLRHDALHTPVPPNVARRLQESIANLPAPPPRSWWQRLLGS